jgi:arylsulfatase A-like enzyme
MPRDLNRKEFLKLSSLPPLFYILPKMEKRRNETAKDSLGQSILILVFDAFSGSHLLLNGYPRLTTPNLNRFAEKATVYHHHYSPGNFTTPGVASLLTGTYPFTHRAFQTNGKAIPEFVNKNLFTQFEDYYRIAYTHNTVANTLLREFISGLDLLKPPPDLFLSSNTFLNTLFSRDNDIAFLSWSRIFGQDEKFSNSLFLSEFNQKISQTKIDQYKDEFPGGLPEVRSGEVFLLENAIDWIKIQVNQLPKPFLGYFHFFPPHNPYHTRREFIRHYHQDGYNPVAKPPHPFSGDFDQKLLNDLRRKYDEYILYLDAEFGRLYKYLEQEGYTENTWIIFTSDHGELFERGIWRHTTPTLFESVIRIPLLISAPGQTARLDITTATSAIDILPPLLHLTGKPVPDWCEGQVLPPYLPTSEDEARSLFALEGKTNGKFDPLTIATSMLLKWPWKLTQYSGYDKLNDQPYYDLFNLDEDPEELSNQYSPASTEAAAMVDELETRLAAADSPYLK